MPLTGRGTLVTDSRLRSRLCFWLSESQFETREKDFFFLKGGRRTSGSGGGSVIPAGRALVGDTKVFDASSKVFEGSGIWRGERIGAVCGRMMSSLSRSAKDGAAGGRAGMEGIGARALVAC